ncbi:MAG: class I SAM-dependent methyltransferase [Propionibacteriaceae bacterium]
MSHYFETPEGPDRRQSIQITVAGRTVEVETSRGVFSGDHLDHATALLLTSCEPEPTSRTFLDLGCGWGPIALSLASRCPDSQIIAVDVNERALALTRDNADRLGLRQVETLLPDMVDPELCFDEIWSNPPIRIGKPAVHELLLRWLPRLTPTGVARLVIGKNLGADSYQSWLNDQGFSTTRRTSAKGFRVLDVRHP